jgi:hypothetical protein
VTARARRQRAKLSERQLRLYDRGWRQVKRPGHWKHPSLEGGTWPEADAARLEEEWDEDTDWARKHFADRIAPVF